MAYLTGFDPRWEEALLIIKVGATPLLLVGNEDVTYAHAIGFPIDIMRFSKFSLLGQPDPENLNLEDVFAQARLSGNRSGIVGWKWYRGSGTTDWSDVPHYIVESLAAVASSVENATDIFTGFESGLRYHCESDQIAAFEFAASHASSSVMAMIEAVKPGMTELEASKLMNPILLPFSYHPTLLSGENVTYGIASAGSRELQVGDPMATGLGYWGGNTARAGYLVEDSNQLPSHAKDYLERLVLPYFATAVAWYENIRIGMSAGELYDITFSRIGDPFFGVFLNPGHFIHMDEWPGSPVSQGATTLFESGNALQLDIIPMPSNGYHTSQIEDGIVLADSALRDEIAEEYPDVWSRMQARRSRMSEFFGIELHDEVLPLSNSAGYLPPFWLAPHLAVARV